jgi:transcriptional regulator with GAF, ATPase, and Fis domain
MSENKDAIRLIIKKLGQADRTLQFAGSRVLAIGRNPHAQLVLAEQEGEFAVSRVHAALIPLGDNRVVMQDLGSRNGTAVNKKPEPYWYLKDGDRIAIGPYELVYERSTESSVAAGSSPRLIVDDRAALEKTGVFPLVTLQNQPADAEDQRTIRILYGLLRAVALQPDFAHACTAAIRALMESFSLTRGTMIEISSAGEPVRIIASVPEPGDFVCSRSLVRTVLETGAPLVYEDIARDRGPEGQAALSQSILRSGAVGVLCIPLRVHGTIRLMLYFDKKNLVTFSDADRELMALIGRDLSKLLEVHFAAHVFAQDKARRDLYDSAFRRIAGISPKVNSTLEEVRMYGRTDVPVLIVGETGTGKELIARALHEQSPRVSGPFVEINCAAVPETLLESELFGVIPDYPGFNTKAGLLGRIRAADGGTLFLDEIGDMSTALQAKLLRFLEEKSVWPLGSTQAIIVDVRIIAATNRPIQTKLHDGTFRSDLYQRLSVAEIGFPPLRERREDIPLLAGFFICQFRERYGSVAQLSPEAADYLAGLDWPGNVRELRNTIERAVIRAVSRRSSEITLELLQAPARDFSPLKTLQEVEKEHISKILELVDGSKEKAYKILGISRATLFNKIKEYGITDQS